MNTFKKSFWREIGKNTGKVVSNFIFKDNWSTPYRFSNSKNKIAKEAIKIEENLKKLETKNIIAQKKLEFEFNLIQKYDKKKETIINLSIPDEKNELFQFSNFLISNVYGSGWDQDDEYINLFSDACLKKLQQCKLKFKFMNAIFEVSYLNKEINTLKRKRFFEKYGKIFILLIIVTFGLFFYGAFNI